MSNVPENLRYTESHEWVDPADDEALKIGITDHAQGQLGDLVFVELPAVGDEFDQGDACAVVESVKAASDIYAPVAGEVVAVNEALEDDPALVNTDPYGEGWLFAIKPAEEGAVEDLLDAETYAQQQD
jgi:glycine cleavage system H protein